MNVGVGVDELVAVGIRVGVWLGMAVCVGRGLWDGRIVGKTEAVVGGVGDAQLPINKVINNSAIKRFFMMFFSKFSIAFFFNPIHIMMIIHTFVKSGTFSSLLKSLMLYCAERCARKHKYPLNRAF